MPARSLAYRIRFLRLHAPAYLLFRSRVAFELVGSSSRVYSQLEIFVQIIREILSITHFNEFSSSRFSIRILDKQRSFELIRIYSIIVERMKEDFDCFKRLVLGLMRSFYFILLSVILKTLSVKKE